ncbi:interleukin-36 receptor antagonist protein-like [Emydura macquarii macquarii]|uniref:interleukin-36 receptor antagonist protein-like n=1 Tax=Emydura macquarii macquarii TaxID=1129001 RepID=UPI00352B6205
MASQPGEKQVDKDMEDLFNKFLNKDGEIVLLDLPKPFIFTMRDTKQKVVRLQDNSLVAEASNADPEKLSVVPNRFIQGKQYPIILGVQEGNRCLSCGTSDPPKLQLEDKGIMDLFADQKQAPRFTFHNIAEGSTHRFESAAFPGWFLCTSQNNGEPVSITNQPGATAITEFYFQRLPPV